MDRSKPHPLAHKVRLRSDSVASRETVLKEARPLLDFFREHCDERLSKDTDGIHTCWAFQSLVRSLIRLGLDDEARPLSDRLKSQKNRGRPIYEWFFEEKLKLGDYDAAMAILDDPPIDPERSERGYPKAEFRWDVGGWYFSGRRAALCAVLNGDLDDASRMLDDAADFQATHPDTFVAPKSMGDYWESSNRRGLMRANGELAALAHVMGREDLVRPALYRARFLIEGGQSVSNRPLLESPAWIEKGQSYGVYLIHAIAASGNGELALQLMDDRDLLTLFADMNDVWGGLYNMESIYPALAYGGCPEQALELARNDEKQPLRDRQFLSWFCPHLFRCGDDKNGRALAENCLDLIDQEIRDNVNVERAFGYAAAFARRLNEVGQEALAAEVAQRMLQFACEFGNVFPDKYYGSTGLGQLLRHVSEEDREKAVEQIVARSPADSSSRASMRKTLSVLGVESEGMDDYYLRGSNRFVRRRDHDHLLAAGNAEAARRIFESFVEKASQPKCDHRDVKMALNLCAEYGEMERAAAIISMLAKPPNWVNCLFQLGKHFASQEGVSIEAAFKWAQGLSDPDLQFAANAGILRQCTTELLLIDSCKPSDFPNFQIVNDLGLFASLTEGFSFGC